MGNETLATDQARTEEQISTINRDLTDLALSLRQVAESSAASDTEIRKMVGRKEESARKDKLSIYAIVGPIGIAMFGFVWLAISENTKALEKLHDSEITNAYKEGRQDAILEILLKDYQDGRE